MLDKKTIQRFHGERAPRIDLLAEMARQVVGGQMTIPTFKTYVDAALSAVQHAAYQQGVEAAAQVVESSEQHALCWHEPSRSAAVNDIRALLEGGSS